MSAAEAWLREVAGDRGIELTGPIEMVHSRPWSTVSRAPAGDRCYWPPSLLRWSVAGGCCGGGYGILAGGRVWGGYGGGGG